MALGIPGMQNWKWNRLHATHVRSGSNENLDFCTAYSPVWKCNKVLDHWWVGKFTFHSSPSRPCMECLWDRYFYEFAFLMTWIAENKDCRTGLQKYSHKTLRHYPPTLKSSMIESPILWFVIQLLLLDSIVIEIILQFEKQIIVRLRMCFSTLKEC